ncbi:MAG: Gfo/Idh/MocA family oxidoreductase [Candidatus Eiseniibacteriota bacterium]|jgi:biliverdin reductase
MLKIGVVGAGRAGRARIRAIEAHDGTELGGIVSSQPDVATRGFDELLGDDGVAAVCVCTVNALHEEQVRRALEADKHVVCEYPLALTHDAAVRLYELARERQRVLHVEHIELLSGTQQALRAACRERGFPRPRGGTYESQANSEGWIASLETAGFLSFSGISRLHRLVDLFGPAGVREALYDDHEDEQRLVVELDFAHGGECRLDYRRGRGLPRRERWAIRLDDGDLGTVSPVPTGPLFEQDLLAFVRRVQEGAEPYVSDERILEVLGLADAIRERCEAPTP